MVTACRYITAFFVWLSLLVLGFYFAQIIKPVSYSCSADGGWITGIIMLIFSIWPIRLWRRLKSFQVEDSAESAWVWAQAVLYFSISAPLFSGIINTFDLHKNIAIAHFIINGTAALVGLIASMLQLRRDAKGL